jgi:HEAT repeat protein
MAGEPSIESLFNQAIDNPSESEATWTAINHLHTHATQEIFDRASECCNSPEPRIRAIGLDILAQLRSSNEGREHTFPEHAFQLISKLLGQEHEQQPISSALTALGHIGNPEAVSQCLAFIGHPSVEVRFSAAFALAKFPNNPAAINGLIQLMNDEAPTVRDWATFGLGVLGDSDSTQIREALFRNTSDSDDDTREEAICGLAKRKDSRMIPILQDLLKQPEVSTRISEAADFLSIH